MYEGSSSLDMVRACSNHDDAQCLGGVAASKVATGIIVLALVGPPHLLRAMHLIQGSYMTVPLPDSTVSPTAPHDYDRCGYSHLPILLDDTQSSFCEWLGLMQRNA